MERAIIYVSLAEDIFCHMTCKCTRIDGEHTDMSIENYYTVEESKYEHFAKMMMIMKEHENEIINTLFNEIEDKDEHYLIIKGLLISYYRQIQPQEWSDGRGLSSETKDKKY